MSKYIKLYKTVRLASTVTAETLPKSLGLTSINLDTENVWQIVTSFYITWDLIHLHLLFYMKAILGISPYMKKTCNLLSLELTQFPYHSKQLFYTTKYLYSEKLHAHKKWYNAMCCVWTWFLALQLFQFCHEPLANRHKSRLGQGSNNFCIQVSYNVYICCIWSTLSSGRLNKNFHDSELILNSETQRCKDVMTKKKSTHNGHCLT